MSSVPVQLLIYVQAPPYCPTPPVIVPINGCLEVQVGVPITLNLYAKNMCDPSISVLADIIASSGINGMSSSALRNASANGTLSYVTYSWTPQASQVGLQQLCATAYTE